MYNNVAHLRPYHNLIVNNTIYGLNQKLKFHNNVNKLTNNSTTVPTAITPSCDPLGSANASADYHNGCHIAYTQDVTWECEPKIFAYICQTQPAATSNLHVIAKYVTETYMPTK